MSKETKRLLEQANAIAEIEPQNISYRPSRPFDFFLWLESKELDAYVEGLAKEIDKAAPLRRARDAATHKKFMFSIKLILLNLLAAQKTKLKTLQAIPLGAGEFSVKTRYDQRHIAYRPFIDAYDGLIALKLIRRASKGFNPKAKNKKGWLTRIEVTHPLKKKLDKLFPQEVVFFTRHPDEENIRLKNSTEKKLIDYKDNNYTRTARNNLAVINACLNRHWYDLDLSDAEFSTLHKEMVKRHKKEPKKPASIQFHERSLYRIFNNGDAEGKGFKHGGRFYGGWWEGIPSEYRKKITINGKHTAEIDYSGYHPRMLYAIEGIDLGKRDPYLPNGLNKKWRDFGKLAFTKLLNGKKRLAEPDDYDDKAIGMSWHELLIIMEHYHAPIVKYFRTGYGLELMRKDSDIAERILLHFSKRDIPCLPIHDSFIVHHAHAEELWDIMLKEYQMVFEQNIYKKIDNGFELFTKEYTGQGENTLSIDEILSDRQYSQYDKRLSLWYEQKGNR